MGNLNCLVTNKIYFQKVLYSQNIMEVSGDQNCLVTNLLGDQRKKKESHTGLEQHEAE